MKLFLLTIVALVVLFNAVDARVFPKINGLNLNAEPYVAVAGAPHALVKRSPQWGGYGGYDGGYGGSYGGYGGGYGGYDGGYGGSYGSGYGGYGGGYGGYY